MNIFETYSKCRSPLTVPLVFFVVLVCTPVRAMADLKVTISDYCIGMIEEAKTRQPIGSGFVFESRQYVVTARHVLYDTVTGSQRQLLFQPVKPQDGPGIPALSLTPYRALTKEDLAVLKVHGENRCKQPLTRGDSDSLHVGDLVGYGGYDPSVHTSMAFTISGEPILKCFFADGLKFLQLRGIAIPGFSGGPVFGGGYTVVGVILRGSQPDFTGDTTFDAISAQYIPELKNPLPPK